MALGGVPMGSMLAHEAARVMGMPSKSGWMCAASASPLTTGANTITCATLLITSETKMEMTVSIKINVSGLAP